MIRRIAADGTFLDIFGRPLYNQAEELHISQEEYEADDALSIMRRSIMPIRRTCRAVCADICATEHYILQEGHSPSEVANLKMIAIVARPCCHMLRLCGNCHCTAVQHANGKCILMATTMDLSLSHMDVYCPGWRDRYVGP